MRILTLWEPWASLIALGLKKYETRSWGTRYRGKLLIHAAKRRFIAADGFTVLDRDVDSVWLEALDLAYKQGILDDQSKLPSAHQLPFGCVVAMVDLSDCSRMSQSSRPHCLPTNICIDKQSVLERAVGNWDIGRYAWKLENIIALPTPIPWKGGQGLRYAPLELVELVNQQLKEVS